MAQNLCSHCVEDRFLRNHILQEGKAASCNCCNQERDHTITIERLGEHLEPVLRELYEQGDFAPTFDDCDDDDFPLVEQWGVGLLEIIPEVVGQEFPFNFEIVEAVIATQARAVGETDFFSLTANYVSRPLYHSDLSRRWRMVEAEVGQSRRFFSETAKEFFDYLFADVDEVKTDAVAAKGDRRVVTTYTQGSKIYRGRTCDSPAMRTEMYLKPFEAVGPPRACYARAGRMNPDGVPVFYGAEDASTCLAELRPALSGEAAVIALRTTRPLRMLDFTRMATAYKPLSYFQPDYREQEMKNSFLRGLGISISRPVIPGHEGEYLTTQVMAEYLSHVHAQPFDGVIFSSAQRAGGKNIVLFNKPDYDARFPIEYIDGSFEIYKTKTISYEHERLAIRFIDGALEQEFEHL